MKQKQIKVPGPEHPISIERNPARIVVSVARRVIADTRNARLRPSQVILWKILIISSQQMPEARSF
jgi:uncharacterized protein (DUF427 family)